MLFAPFRQRRLGYCLVPTGKVADAGARIVTAPGTSDVMRIKLLVRRAGVRSILRALRIAIDQRRKDERDKSRTENSGKNISHDEPPLAGLHLGLVPGT